MADPLVKNLYVNLIGNPGSISDHTYDTLPDDDNIGLTGGAANVFGAYVQIAASVGAADIWLCGLFVDNASAAADFKIEIGTGAAASETPRIVVPFSEVEESGAGRLSHMFYSLPFPIRVVNGTRLAARVKEGTGSLTNDVVSWHALGLQ